ncbi:MAG: serine hydrolase domain-containing protein [Acidimicrobiia bacterium]
MVEIEGFCDPRFERVREAFAANWDLFDEVGASVAVTVDGQPVVDLWGGWADGARTRRWERDTIVVVASTTKGLTGLCGNMLIDRGQLDPAAPVADYWPEFAQNGKEGVLVEHLFDHRAGLPNMPRGVGPDDWEGVVTALAAKRPRWEPGTGHSYHAATYGYLIGEVIRRVTGLTAGQFLRHEVCEPLGADAWIGVPPELDDRCAEVCGQAAGMDGVALRRYESPAGNGHTNGRALARIFGALACGGELDGVRLLSKETLDDAVATWMTGPWVGFDDDLYEPKGSVPRVTTGLRFCRGFMRSSEMSWMGPSPGAFGSAGSGGSIAVADPEARIGFGYAQNAHLGPLAGVDSRPGRLLQAVYASL